MSRHLTALSMPVLLVEERGEVGACVRRVLNRISSAPDDAYELSCHGGVILLVMAKHYAGVMGTGPEKGPFNLPVLGAWFASGPYPGLSLVSGLLAEMDVPSVVENLDDLAKPSFHARNLMVGVPPFADEMIHGPFQKMYRRLRAVVEESHDR